MTREPVARVQSWYTQYVIIESAKGNATSTLEDIVYKKGGGPRVVVITAAFHARVRGSVPGLGGLKETIVSPPSTCES